MTSILTSVIMVEWADVPDSDFRRRRAVDISGFDIYMKKLSLELSYL